MNRLFISADIPDEIKEKVIEIRNEIYGLDKNIRWEGKEKLHFTLKFLGDIEESKNRAIINDLQAILSNFKSINCSFSKFGLFKKGDIPSKLWLGLKYNAELNQIAEAINNNFVQLGFEKEKRKFKPHLTLLRLKGREDISRINDFLEYEFPEMNFIINEISVMKSELLKSGSFYSKIKSFKLNNRRENE